MPSSSQPGPFNRPSSSSSPPARRLRSPSERFGSPPETELQTPPIEDAPQILEPEPARSSSTRPRKSRHERRRFEREEHRFTARPAPRRTVETRLRSPRTSVENRATGDVPVQTEAPPSPTLARIQTARKRFWRRFTGFFIGLSLAGAGAAALWAPQFNIEQVTITGLHATSPVLVRPIAARLLGRNVFRVPKTPIIQAVERVPTVAKARIVLRAGLPPRVVLQVREREPIARVGDGTSWWVADSQGVPYRAANARDAALPMLKWRGEIQTMKRFDVEAWNDAVRLIEAVESAQKAITPLPPVREMTLDASGDATLSLRKAPQVPVLVRLGNDGWSEKLSRACVALAYFRRTHRDAQELNLIALKPNGTRWTPCPVSAPSGEAPRSQPESRAG